MEKNKQWKWARTSENVTAVKAIESQYLHTFKMSKRQEGGTKEKENSENTKAARPMQGTSGPRDSGLRRHFRESVR